MNPDIFREYDIRGIAGKDMTENDVIQIGKGVGTYLLQHNRSKLTVGRDCRETSDLYAEKNNRGSFVNRLRCYRYRGLSNTCPLFFNHPSQAGRRCYDHCQP